MDIHDIHGIPIGFDVDAREARHFLDQKVRSHVLLDYLRVARSRGEMHFYDDKGDKFRIKYEKDEEGKDIFFVKKSHH